MATKSEIAEWARAGARVVGMDDYGHRVGTIERVDDDGDVYIGGRLFNPHEVSLYVRPTHGVAAMRAREIVGQLEALVSGLDNGGLNSWGAMNHAQEILEGARRLRDLIVEEVVP